MKVAKDVTELAGSTPNTIEEKLECFRGILRSLESVIIAYSGGVDSTFLSRIAFDVLGGKALAVTARSETYPSSEFQEAVEFAGKIAIKHETIVSEELDVPEFSGNPVNRCYYCKKELFTKLKETAERHGLKHVVDGSNFEDIDDHRPGMQAAAELGVRSPLKEVKLTKADIRELSRKLGLPTWDKPSFACLSSRFPLRKQDHTRKAHSNRRSRDISEESGYPSTTGQASRPDRSDRSQ